MGCLPGTSWHDPLGRIAIGSSNGAAHHHIACIQVRSTPLLQQEITGWSRPGYLPSFPPWASPSKASTNVIVHTFGHLPPVFATSDVSKRPASMQGPCRLPRGTQFRLGPSS